MKACILIEYGARATRTHAVRWNLTTRLSHRVDGVVQ